MTILSILSSIFAKNVLYLWQRYYIFSAIILLKNLLKEIVLSFISKMFDDFNSFS